MIRSSGSTYKNFSLSEQYVTDAIKSVTIPAIVYYINTLYSQSCERDKGESTYLLIGGCFLQNYKL